MQIKIIALSTLIMSIAAISPIKAKNLELMPHNCKNCPVSNLNFNIARTELKPTVTIKYSYYQIRGTTAKELRQEMNQKGILTPQESNRYDAATYWNVKWQYSYLSKPNSCVINSVNTSVDILFKLPKWQIVSGTSPALIAKWNRYMANLQTHENGHKDHGIAAADQILQTLKRLPPAKSCQSLGAKANSSGDKIIAHYNQEDINYDRVTQHGKTQGAIFP